MRFEKPVAEITKFELKDIISTSETEDHTQAESDFAGQCNNTQTDFYGIAPCA